MKTRKNVLQVGYGGFGRHHLTSIKKIANCFVFDPFIEISDSDITVVKDLSRIVEVSFDTIIIAVNASKHLSIFDDLKRRNIKYRQVIIEKIPDNSLKSNEVNAKSLFVNFPRRHYPFYRSLRTYCLENELREIDIRGGNNSLLCNALHYVDIFEFLTGNKTKSIVANLDDSFPAKRSGFFEATGNLSCETSAAKLSISNDLEQKPNNIRMVFGDGTFFSYVEREGIIENTTKFSWEGQIVKNQSVLTSEYLEESHLLPLFEEFCETNSLLLNAIKQQIPNDGQRVLIT